MIIHIDRQFSWRVSINTKVLESPIKVDQYTL